MAKANTPSPGRKKPSQTAKTGTDTAQPSDESKDKADTSAASKAGKSAAGKAAASKTETPVEKKTAEPAKVSAPKDAKEVSDAPKSEKSADDAAKSSTEPDKAKSGAPESPAKGEAKPAPAPKPASPPPPEQGGFWPLVAGGVIAGIIGFAAGQFDLLGTRGDTAEMQARLNAQASQLSTQDQRIDTLEGATPAAVDLSGIEASLSDLSDTVATLEAELAELSRRPAPAASGTSEDAQAYAEELAALRQSVEAQKGEIDRLLDNARTVEEATAEAARAAAAQTALARITAAISSGAAYDAPVQDLAGRGVADVPAALTENAAGGVDPLLTLQEDFPDAARAALAAARSAGSDGGAEGITGFLRRQLEARSVAPREGSDPDAILSRAEAAVRQGDIAGALDETDGLPPEAQEAMADWIARARARAEAEAAVQALSERLTAN